MSELEQLARRKEEAVEQTSAAFASVRLLAPAAVLRIIRGIEHLGDAHGPTSPEFLGAMDRLTAILRADLGLDADDAAAGTPGPAPAGAPTWTSDAPRIDRGVAGSDPSGSGVSTGNRPYRADSMTRWSHPS